MIEFNPDWQLVLQLVVAVLLPLLVGLVTKVTTAPGTKALLLLTLSLVAGVLGDLLYALEAGVSIDLFKVILFWIGTFITGVAAHYGLMKPTGASSAVAEIGVKAKHVADQ